MGKWINWRKPKLYQEKLQWLKVYNRQKHYTEMVDKITAKDYAARIIGENTLYQPWEFGIILMRLILRNYRINLC